jgi:hypothetical protein
VAALGPSTVAAVGIGRGVMCRLPEDVCGYEPGAVIVRVNEHLPPLTEYV